MHWCVEGCSFQPFLKLCFLVKWLIFSQRWNLAFCSDEYENAYHPQITLRLPKVRIFKKNSNTLFKRMSALSQFYVFVFLTHLSFNLEIAFFAPFILLFVFPESNACISFFKKNSFKKKQPLEPSIKAAA
ncbi:hypothetical protein HJG60_009916 [Phyllostomus discolor]|uniref:Uncharacterized protein n=1 Tax=Phyllostomus discolor TaxID=89673 RepID=A0A834EQL4_9CHIR|nr:hypothetical protein HJG60_009916 [Phyllostomus discolor]